jgi:5-methyltetrahydropteroyltriglutamate--homocysteine methyltransferase
MTFSVDSTLTGIHSRSEETVRISRDFDRLRTNKETLDSTFEADAKNLVKLQLECGISRISDGQLLWQDFLRPFSENLDGLEGGADLFRWFDTNSFFRKPFVRRRVKLPKDRSFIQEYEVATAISLAKERGAKKKVSIPGPYTLASLVADEHYGSKREELIDDFAKVIKKLLKNLASLGFEAVQINEPSLVYRYGTSALTSKKELKGFISAFEDNLDSPPLPISLHTYFGDCSKILGKLLELDGVSEIGIDFTQTSLDSIEKTEFGEMSLACGCVDGRNSLVESPEWIADYCIDAVKSLQPSGLTILPSSELKYLPRTVADEKIRAIGKAAALARKRLN